MRIVKPSIEIIDMPDYLSMVKKIERAGRTCYKSENKMTDFSGEKFIERIIDSGHESVIEHSIITVKFFCDRGISHELVRHRLCSFSQESTRYCNYSQDKFDRELTFIQPMFWAEDSDAYNLWCLTMIEAENNYMKLLDMGASPQEARSILPNSLKTEIVVTANLREWRTIFKQRCARAAHPQIRQVMISLLDYCRENYPVFFSDLTALLLLSKDQFTANNWELAEVR